LLELWHAITGSVGLLELIQPSLCCFCCLLWMPLRALLLGFLQLAVMLCPKITFLVLTVIFVYGYASYG
jgi:hypothetical protein